MICLLSRSSNVLRSNTGDESFYEDYVELLPSEFMNGHAVLRFVVARYVAHMTKKEEGVAPR